MLAECVGRAMNVPVWYFLVYLVEFVFLDILNEGFKSCVFLPIMSLLVFFLHFFFGNMYFGPLEEKLPAKYCCCDTLLGEHIEQEN